VSIQENYSLNAERSSPKMKTCYMISLWLIINTFAAVFIMTGYRISIGLSYIDYTNIEMLIADIGWATMCITAYIHQERKERQNRTLVALHSD